MYSTFICSINIDSQSIGLIRGKFPNIEIEISCYPTEEIDVDE